MSQLFYLPFQPVFGTRGLPLGAAKVYFYASGSTSLKTIYSDAALTVPMANPVSADALGRLPVIYMPDDQQYRVRITDRIGTPLGDDLDPYIAGTLGGLSGPTGPADNTYTSLTALLASDKTRKKANLVGDTDVPPAPDGPFNVVDGQWARQEADGIAFNGTALGASPVSVGDTLDSLMVSPEQFLAKGDGVTDDTAEIQAALNSGRSIRLTQGKQYLIKSRLLINIPKISIVGGGTLKFSPDWNFAADTSGPNSHFRGIFVEAEGVTFDGVIFDATGVPGGTGVENGFIWCTAPSMTVSDCQFFGNPKGTCVWGVGGSPFLTFSGNKVFRSTAAVFVRERDASITNNTINGATDAAIALNGLPCTGAVVANNTIRNEDLAELPSVIAVEEGASEWAITGNNLHGANGGGIWCGNVVTLPDGSFPVVRGGTISGNVVSVYNDPTVRPPAVNPGSLLYISQYYTNTNVTGNVFIGAPGGDPRTRLAIFAANGTIFQGNTLEGSGADGIQALVSILSGKGGVTISNNRSLSAPSGRHFLFSPGDYGLAPCIFDGGEFLGGAEAINSELQAATIFNFRLHIKNLTQVTAAAVVNAATAIGDRGAFLNADKAQMPHSIDVRTEMYCNAVPANSGALPFMNGDRFHANDPVGAGCLTYVKVPGGTPFTKWGGPVA